MARKIVELPPRRRQSSTAIAACLIAVLAVLSSSCEASAGVGGFLRSSSTAITADPTRTTIASSSPLHGTFSSSRALQQGEDHEGEHDDHEEDHDEEEDHENEQNPEEAAVIIFDGEVVDPASATAGETDGDGDNDHEDDHADDHDDHETEDDEHDEEGEGDHDHDVEAGADAHDDEHDEEEEGDHDEHDDHEDHEGSSSSSSAALASDGNENSKPWGEVIGFSLLVNVVSLIGVMFLIPSVAGTKLCCASFYNRNNMNKTNSTGNHHFMDIIIPCFAAGALLATVFFIIIPEALHLLEAGKVRMISEAGDDHEDHSDHGHRLLQDEHDGHGEESGAAWKFGAAILGGYLLPIILGALFPRNVRDEECDDEDCKHAAHANHDHINTNMHGSVRDSIRGLYTDHMPKSIELEKGDNSTNEDVEDAHAPPSPDFGDKDFDEENAIENNIENEESTKLVYRQVINKKLCCSILMGDFFHNFADGIFIGVAFMLCSKDVAYAIVAATIYHEIAQELADFFLLTRHGGLTVLWALALNFLSGLGVMLGGITILSVEGLTKLSVGVILCIGAGTYIHVAASESIPRAESTQHTWKDRLLAVVMFCLGAVPIGLVLLNHFHCD